MILDIQLLVQGLLYLGIFVVGFAVSIPLGITNINFGGECILYASIKWKDDLHFQYTPTNYTNCNFSIYLSVVACIFYGLGMTVYHAYAFFMSRDPNIGSKMWVMPFILLNSCIMFTVFISSCMISVGFKVLCDGLTSKTTMTSCASGQKWKWYNPNKDNEEYNGKTYFIYLTVTQIATWVCFLMWLVQVALGILRFVRNRRLRSKDQFQDPAPSPDGPANSKAPADLENFASVEPTA